MLKHLTILGVTIVLTAHAFAQPDSTTIPTFLDIGGIRAPHYPAGDMWWSPADTSFLGLEFPLGDTTSVRGFGSIMIAGIDGSGTVHAAGNIYRNPGSDFQPGPIVSGDSATQAKSRAAWTKIWKINSADIDLFLANRASGTPGIPQRILEWPAIGNPFAKGAGGAALTLSNHYAPFVDANSDGVYNPYDGDYPEMKGSQMLWWIFNDAKAHPLSMTPSIGAEIIVKAYEYATGTIAQNAIFYEYEFMNGGTALTGFHFATMNDLDIGYAFNDMLGVDSARRVAIIYNGNPESGTQYTGNPAAGMLLLEQPGDGYSNRTPLRNMNFPDAVQLNSGQKIYQALSGSQNTARHDWNGGLDYECGRGNQAADRAFLMSTQSIPMAANTSHRFSFALIMADSIGACPTATFDRVLATADTAYERYWHPSRHTPGSNPTKVGGVVAGALRVYPNPVDNILHVDMSLENPAVHVTNAVGAVVDVPVRATTSGIELNTKALTPGIYYLQLRSTIDGSSSSTRFIKL